MFSLSSLLGKGQNKVPFKPATFEDSEVGLCESEATSRCKPKLSVLDSSVLSHTPSVINSDYSNKNNQDLLGNNSQNISPTESNSDIIPNVSSSLHNSSICFSANDAGSILDQSLSASDSVDTFTATKDTVDYAAVLSCTSENQTNYLTVTKDCVDRTTDLLSEGDTDCSSALTKEYAGIVNESSVIESTSDTGVLAGDNVLKLVSPSTNVADSRSIANCSGILMSTNQNGCSGYMINSGNFLGVADTGLKLGSHTSLEISSSPSQVPNLSLDKQICNVNETINVVEVTDGNPSIDFPQNHVGYGQMYISASEKSQTEAKHSLGFTAVNNPAYMSASYELKPGFNPSTLSPYNYAVTNKRIHQPAITDSWHEKSSSAISNIDGEKIDSKVSWSHHSSLCYSSSPVMTASTHVDMSQKYATPLVSEHKQVQNNIDNKCQEFFNVSETKVVPISPLLEEQCSSTVASGNNVIQSTDDGTVRSLSTSDVMKANHHSDREIIGGTAPKESCQDTLTVMANILLKLKNKDLDSYCISEISSEIRTFYIHLQNKFPELMRLLSEYQESPDNVIIVKTAVDEVLNSTKIKESSAVQNVLDCSDSAGIVPSLAAGTTNDVVLPCNEDGSISQHELLENCQTFSQEICQNMQNLDSTFKNELQKIQTKFDTLTKKFQKLEVAYEEALHQCQELKELQCVSEGKGHLFNIVMFVKCKKLQRDNVVLQNLCNRLNDLALLVIEGKVDDETLKNELTRLDARDKLREAHFRSMLEVYLQNRRHVSELKIKILHLLGAAVPVCKIFGYADFEQFIDNFSGMWNVGDFTPLMKCLPEMRSKKIYSLVEQGLSEECTINITTNGSPPINRLSFPCTSASDVTQENNAEVEVDEMSISKNFGEGHMGKGTQQSQHEKPVQAVNTDFKSDRSPTSHADDNELQTREACSSLDADSGKMLSLLSSASDKVTRRRKLKAMCVAVLFAVKLLKLHRVSISHTDADTHGWWPVMPDCNISGKNTETVACEEYQEEKNSDESEMPVSEKCKQILDKRPFKCKDGNQLSRASSERQLNDEKDETELYSSDDKETVKVKSRKNVKRSASFGLPSKQDEKVKTKKNSKDFREYLPAEKVTRQKKVDSNLCPEETYKDPNENLISILKEEITGSKKGIEHKEKSIEEPGVRRSYSSILSSSFPGMSSDAKKAMGDVGATPSFDTSRVTLTSQKSNKIKNFGKLVDFLVDTFPRVKRSDLQASIMEIRKMHNNSISGKSFPYLAQEVQAYLLDRTGADESQCCLICMQPYGTLHTVLLTCLHCFHEQCIHPWLACMDQMCPTCSQVSYAESILQS